MYWEDLCPLKVVSINHCMKKAYQKNEWLSWDLNPCIFTRLELLAVLLTTTPWTLFLVKGALRWFILVTGWSNPPRSQRLHWVVVEKFSPLIFFLEGKDSSGLRSSGDHLVGMPFVIRVLVLIICLCPMVVPETCMPGLGRPCRQQSILMNHRIGHHAFDWGNHAVTIFIPHLPLGQIGSLSIWAVSFGNAQLPAWLKPIHCTKDGWRLRFGVPPLLLSVWSLTRMCCLLGYIPFENFSKILTLENHTVHFI